MSKNSSDGTLIKITKIEQVGRGKFNKFGLVNTTNLNGRPTKVLQHFIDTGIERHWWDKVSFEKVVELCWGKDFVEDLKAMSERKERERRK